MSDFSAEMGQMARAQAESMRNKAQARAAQRKEEYLGARVSKALRERVFQRAEVLDMPASLLIRQVLEQAFPEEPGVSANAVAAQSVAAAVKATPSIAMDSIIAWETLTLGKDMACQMCQQPLQKGGAIMMGVSTDSKVRPMLCCECQKKL